MAGDQDTAEARYARLKSDRDPYLMRARECAKFTIPTLFPPEGSSGSTKLPSPYQSMGARGVNALASKLLLTLLPPNSPFFRYEISDAVAKQLAGDPDGAPKRGKIEAALSDIEREVMSEVETSNMRPPTFESIKQLIVAGNVLLFFPPKSTQPKFFRLDRYVVRRAADDSLQEIITEEDILPEDIPDEVRPLVDLKDEEARQGSQSKIKLYTRVSLEDGQWIILQEVNGKEVPGTRYTRPVGKLPYLALRFFIMPGEHYGRSYVEEYIGDIKSYEGLSKAIVQASAAAAKVLFLVKPNSTTNKRRIAQAETGAIEEGNADDVTVLQMEKYGDFRVAKETIDSLRESLSFAFLLNTAIQRNGERVTAEEIRYMANELESALGGIYSNLAQDFQLPLLNIIEDRLVKAKRIPKLPGVKAVAVTGIEAIGRGQDRMKLAGFLQDLTSTVGPEIVAQKVNMDELIDRMGASWSIDTNGLIKTPEEQAQEQQMAQMRQLIETLGPNAVNQLGALAKERMSQQQPAAPTGAPA